MAGTRHGRTAEVAEVGIVVIGRNEGERLELCLNSVIGSGPTVYVDSGSTDGSVAMAERLGVEVVELAVPPPFTAARARNAGLERLGKCFPAVRYVQMVDGDCEVRADWIDQAVAALRVDPTLALVSGRRRERHPERSVYNALCDQEWDTPVGEASGCGGDALFRVEALRSVGGYEATMIAGEDTEMSMRLRKHGWRLRRLAVEMTWHDADITRFGQWWQRAKRGGHGFAEMARRHPDARWPNWPGTCRSIMAWGGVFPAALLATIAVAAALGGGWWLAPGALVSGWAAQVGRIAWSGHRVGLGIRVALIRAFLLMLGKVPEWTGLMQFHRNRQRGAASTLIEYKGPKPA